MSEPRRIAIMNREAVRRLFGQKPTSREQESAAKFHKKVCAAKERFPRTERR
jgi:hypothetical protein